MKCGVNKMTQFLDKAGLQHYTSIIKDKLNDLAGRGRYLSLWNCGTGLAETDPPTSPYTYRAGDYFIVGHAYKKSEIGPESLSTAVLYPTTGDFGVTLNEETYMAYVEPTQDTDNVFAYNKVSVDYSNAHGTEKLAVVDLPKYELVLSQREAHVVELVGDRFISLPDDTLRTRWFEYSNVLYVELQYKAEVWNEQYTDTYISDYTIKALRFENSTLYPLDDKKQMIRDFYLEEAGIEIVGDFYYGMAPWYEEIIITDAEDSAEARWTMNGNELPEGVTYADYGIGWGGRPAVEGDAFKISYRTEKYNYKPDGLQYVTGVASTVKETGEVAIDDNYIFDGAVWRLQKTSQKQVLFSDVLGDPHDNSSLDTALDSAAETAVWGGVTGTLADQTDLKNALDAKANTADVYDKTTVDTLLTAKQDKLIEGNNITINASTNEIATADKTLISFVVWEEVEDEEEA